MVQPVEPRQEGGSREAEFWRSAVPSREPVRHRLYLPAVLVLTALSVPFYWAPAGGLWLLGLPAWVWTTVACSAGLSAVTAWGAWRQWRDEDDGARG